MSRNHESKVPPHRPRGKGKRVTAFGESKTIADWAKDPRCTVTANALAVRLMRGWHPEAAIAGRQAKSNTREAVRPKKPNPSYPLWWHAGSRNWAKKIAGGTYYFGADPETALARYLRERDFILAGQAPLLEEQDNAVTVRCCCRAFLEAKQRQKAAGELADRSFVRYFDSAAFLVDHFGKTRDAATLRPEDFERLRTAMAERWGPVALGNEIQIVRMIFARAYKSELLAVPVRFGPGFKKPSPRKQRESRFAKGEQVFSPEQVKALLAEAGPQMKAMILLGLNGGLGCSDLANLELDQVDLDVGWYNVMRAKTATQRRFPYWPETIEALREAIEDRGDPTAAEDKSLVFIGPRGSNYKARDRVTNLFMRTRDRAKVDKSRTFCDLRRSCQTVAANATNDERAVALVLGHAVRQNDVPGRNFQPIDDARLLAVTGAVRGWLWPKCVHNLKESRQSGACR